MNSSQTPTTDSWWTTEQQMVVQEDLPVLLSNLFCLSHEQTGSSIHVFQMNRIHTSINLCDVRTYVLFSPTNVKCVIFAPK